MLLCRVGCRGAVVLVVMAGAIASWPVMMWAQDNAAGDPPPVDEGGLATEETLARFEQLLERRPFHGPAFEGLVKHYAERGDLDELIAHYAEKQAALPDDIALRILLARVQLRGGNAEAAAAMIEPVESLPEELAGSEQELLIFKSEVFERTGRDEDAQRMLERALAGATAMADRLQLAEALSDLFLRRNRMEEAAEALRALAREFPEDYLHRKRIADALAQRQLHAPAVEEYRAVLDLTADDPARRAEVLRSTGRSLEALERRDEAIAVYTDAMTLLSSDHWLQRELHERIVALYRAEGRLDELAEYARGQVARAPEQPAVHVLLSEVLAASGDLEGAQAALVEAVHLFPADEGLSRHLIQFFERHQLSEAVAGEYQRIIAQHPANAELYIDFGEFLARAEQVEAARNQWRHVLAGEAVTAALAMRLGALFEANDLVEDAAETYERAIALQPNLPDGYLALSRLWRLRGDSEEAAEPLERAIAANPEDAALHAAAAQEYLNLAMAEEALAAAQRAAELAPAIEQHQILYSDLLVHEGRLDEALAVRRALLERMTPVSRQAQAARVLVSMHASAGALEALRSEETARLEDDPADSVSRLLLAFAADAERDFRGAREHLSALLETHPDHEAAREQLARLYDAVGDVDRAVEEYRRLIDLAPNRSRQFYQAIADLRLRYDDLRGAIETFESMVRASPDNATVMKEVAEQLVRLGEPERAVDYFERSLRLQPARHEVRLAYGKALVEAGRLDDALAAFRAAAVQQNDRETAGEALGRLHETAVQLGSLEDLIDDLEQEVAREPDNSLLAQMLASILVREFEYQRAMELVDLVLRHQPRDVEARLVRGDVLRRLGRYAEALEEYRRALRAPDMDRDYVLGEMGKTAFEAGQVDEARRYWLQIQHRQYAASLLRNNGLVNDAVDVLRDGIRMKPDEFALYRSLIAALQGAGRTAEALEAARRLLDLQPDNVFNIVELAQAYLKEGDRASAAEIAGRLFSAAVAEDASQPGPSAGASSWGSGSMIQAMYSQGYGYGYGAAPRSNLERGVEFFLENGLVSELEEVLTQQLTDQPENALLRQQAAALYSEEFGKPEVALQLLVELETLEFPIEHQEWLGQTSQRDAMRIAQYNLIAMRPSLRDGRLAELNRQVDDLTADEMLELAVIRQSQGMTDEAIGLLERCVSAQLDDVLATGALVDTLMQAERFAEAQPHAERLVAVLRDRRAPMLDAISERVRRDYVRTLPLELQLQIDDKLLRDVAEKWTLGQGLMMQYFAGSGGGITPTGWFRAQIALATVYAETDQMDRAREIWKEMTPENAADVESLTMLADIAQLHDQRDLAYEFYTRAMEGSKLLAGDPLLQQLFGSGFGSLWNRGGDAVDSSFNRLVSTFAEADQLMALCMFLRENGQTARARRIAEQYDLSDQLQGEYAAEVEAARAAFLASPGDSLRASVPYLMAVCKLAEIHDEAGSWTAAEAVYRAYLEDFPDEIGLLTTLGEVAEENRNFAAAIDWEERVLDAKQRLSRQARAWSLRHLPMLPEPPRILEAAGAVDYDWYERWGQSSSSWYYGGGSAGQFDQSSSWLRIAGLYLADGNSIAAAEALQQATALAGSRRDRIGQQILSLVRQRRLVAEMLPVLRTLAVYSPTDEQVQLTFAESLEANERPAVAAEVYQRLLRRGVSDLTVLAEVRRKVAALDPSMAESTTTLAMLEDEVAADPANARKRLRLAKAYYYSFDLDRALKLLEEVAASTPDLEGVLDLIIEIHTLRPENQGALIEALEAKIKRTSDEDERLRARRRLVEAIAAQGDIERALEAAKEMGDARDPSSYIETAMLLHYFGRHDEAVAQVELAEKSQAQGGWQGEIAGQWLSRSFALRGELDKAAAEIIAAIDEQAKQAMQYGGMYAMYGYGGEANLFAGYAPLFVMHPEIAERVHATIEGRHTADPAEPQHARLLMQLERQMGRADRAEALLQKMVAEGAGDESMLQSMIESAIARRDFDKAIELAQRFISQQGKPSLPPGVPPEYAGMMMLRSPRNAMLCTLGDIYWDLGDEEKAFEQYRQILDEEVDATRMAYAAICALRDRIDEARQIVDDALAAQEVKAPSLLQFRAFIAALDDQPDVVFDQLAAAMESTDDESDPMMYMYGGGGGGDLSMLARLAQRAGLVDRFAEIARKRITEDPHSWDNYRLLADVLRQAGRMEEAAALIDDALAIPTIEAQALSQKLRWLGQNPPAAEAIPIYERLIELAESEVGDAEGYGYGSSDIVGSYSASYRIQLGTILWKAGNKERAIEVWTERMDLRNPASHLQMARQFQELEDRPRARASYEAALELDPDSGAAHLGLAELAYGSGDLAAALPHLQWYYVRGQEESIDGSYSEYNGYDPYRGWQGDRESQLRLIALEAQRQGLAPKSGPDAGEADAVEARTAMAALLGRWKELEVTLHARLDEAPYDPLAWSLRAEAMMRRGDWQGAAEAHEFLQRLALTTLPQHREQLELVLAGEQVQEAAGGSRTAQPGMPPGFPGGGYRGGYSSYYSPYGYGWGDSDELVSLYVRQKEFDKAERLLLFSSGSVTSSLPYLASLLWGQNERERGLELMRLGIIMSVDGSGSMVPSYARLLDEVGRTDEALELLVRAYRWRLSEYGSYYSRWYGQGESFEDSDEQRLSRAIHDMLIRSGQREEFLKSLHAKASANPDDERLAKLVLSLQIHGGDWDDAHAAIGEWRAARPEKQGIKLEHLHAKLQLGRWDEALALANELMTEAPEMEDEMRRHIAFIRLMMGNPEEAVAVMAPLTERVRTSRSSGWGGPIYTALAEAEDYDALIAYLSRVRSQSELAADESQVLFAALALRQRWDEAARLAIEETWKSAEPVSPALPWYRALARLANQAEDAGATISLDGLDAADQALLLVATAGPQAGAERFGALTGGDDSAQPDPELYAKAQRGLVLAAVLSDDFAAAAEINGRFLAWLETHAMEPWRRRAAASLAETVAAQLEQMRADYDVSTLVTEGRHEAMLLQVLSSAMSQPVVTFSTLTPGHQRWQRTLLAAAGEYDGLAALLQTQATSTSSGYGYDDYEYQQMMRYSGGYDPYDDESSYYRGSDPDLAGGWEHGLRNFLWRHHELDLLAEEYAQSQLRTPSTEWPRVIATMESLGLTEEAGQWRDRIAEAELASLLATDRPGGEDGRQQFYSWRWYGYEYADPAGEQVRRALRFAIDEPGSSPLREVTGATETSQSMMYRGAEAPLAWQWALREPEIEEQLLQLAEEVGPGWESTATMENIVNLLDARHENARIIELVELAVPAEERLQAPLLAQYLEACIEAGELDRVDAVLEAAGDLGPSFRDDIDLLRLMVLRHRGQTSEGDALEQELLTRCVEAEPNINPLDESEWRLNTWFTRAGSMYDRLESLGARSYGSYWSRFGGSETRYLPTVQSLAGAMGVRLDEAAVQGNLTPGMIAQRYLEHRLFADADRVLGMVIDKSVDPFEQAEQMLLRARARHESGDAAAAREAWERAEEILQAEIEARPGDVVARRRLLALYLAVEPEPLWEKAAGVLAQLKQGDPMYDDTGLLDAAVCFGTGRYEEAWALYRGGLREGMTDVMSPRDLYAAGFSAHHAGEVGAAKQLLRRAVNAYPADDLAEAARKVLNE